MISARSTGQPIRSRASTLSAWIWMCLETAPCFNRSIVPVTGVRAGTLAGWLSNPLTDKKEIVKRQEAVKN